MRPRKNFLPKSQNASLIIANCRGPNCATVSSWPPVSHLPCRDLGQHHIHRSVYTVETDQSSHQRFRSDPSTIPLLGERCLDGANKCAAATAGIAGVLLEAPVHEKCGNALYAPTSSLGTYSLGLANRAESPRSPVTGSDETSIGGTILGPFFSFRVLSNGLERSRMLPNPRFAERRTESVNPRN